MVSALLMVFKGMLMIDKSSKNKAINYVKDFLFSMYVCEMFNTWYLNCYPLTISLGTSRNESAKNPPNHKLFYLPVCLSKHH